ADPRHFAKLEAIRSVRGLSFPLIHLPPASPPRRGTENATKLAIADLLGRLGLEILPREGLWTALEAPAASARGVGAFGSQLRRACRCTAPHGLGARWGHVTVGGWLG